MSLSLEERFRLHGTLTPSEIEVLFDLQDEDKAAFWDIAKDLREVKANLFSASDFASVVDQFKWVLCGLPSFNKGLSSAIKALELAIDVADTKAHTSHETLTRLEESLETIYEI